eukprot:133419-Amphidinium_carterae.1
MQQPWPMAGHCQQPHDLRATERGLILRLLCTLNFEHVTAWRHPSPVNRPLSLHLADRNRR